MPVDQYLLSIGCIKPIKRISCAFVPKAHIYREKEPSVQWEMEKWIIVWLPLSVLIWKSGESNWETRGKIKKYPNWVHWTGAKMDVLAPKIKPVLITSESRIQMWYSDKWHDDTRRNQSSMEWFVQRAMEWKWQEINLYNMAKHKWNRC